MGEVYRARDTKLGRDVAIKILPQAFATDPDRLARFEREARVLASLNHPHIAQIHGLEGQEGHKARLVSFPDYGTSIGALRNLAGAFQFSGDDTDKKVRSLSGGEKTRLVLARMLLNPPNFLVLDEPTNHLDLATKAMLIEALAGFEGTLLLVSHDRHFLGALSNRVVELGEAEPHVYGAGYAEYVVASGHEAPGMRAAS